MKLLQKFILTGISNESGILKVKLLKDLNLFYLITILLLIVTGVLQIIFNPLRGAILNFSTAFLFIVTMLFFPANRFDKTGRIISLSILLVYTGICSFWQTDILNAMMIILLLLPVASVILLPKNGIWIASTLGLMILAGNLFPVKEGVETMESSALSVYLISYITVLIVSNYIRNQQISLIKSLVKKISLYESEMKHRDDFMAGLSHRLRTSLSNLTVVNNLVHDSRMNDTQKEFLNTMKSSTNELIKDVNEMVEIATPAFVDFKQSTLSFNLSNTINQILDILSTDVDFTNTFHIEILHEPGYNVIGDPALLRSSILGMVKGISEYELENPEIKLVVTKESETEEKYGMKLQLIFTTGQSNNFLSDFEKLQYNGDPTTAILSNAYRLLAISGSKPESTVQNKTITITFQKEYPKDLSRPILTKSVASELRKTQVAKKLEDATILVVEDNVVNQKIVLLSLNNLVKQIDVANNGKEALDMFGSKKYDVILMDIQMPVMDGITATKKIREIESNWDERVPIIAITAYALSGDRDKCLAAGVDEYISKPFQVNDLTQKIQNLLK